MSDEYQAWSMEHSARTGTKAKAAKLSNERGLLLLESGVTTTSRMRWSKGKCRKVYLWLLLCLQLGIIGSYWLLQNAPTAGIADKVGQTAFSNNLPQLEQQQVSSKSTLLPTQLKRVNFIATKTAESPTQPISSSQAKSILNVTEFERDFFKKPHDIRLKAAAASKPIWCFAQGTLNETHSADHAQQLFCQCASEWHGSQCAQPEIIWRSLMTSKTAAFALRKQLEPATPHYRVNRLFYMLEATFYNMQLLQIQMGSLKHVVDYFVLFQKNSQISSKALKQKVKEILQPQQNYYIYQCSGSVKQDCSTAQAYRSFRQHLNATGNVLVQPNDLFLYSHNSEIFCSNALLYLKYFALNLKPIRFRLKSLMFGFFWQQSQMAQLAGLLTSFEHLDSAQWGNGNPAELLQMCKTSTGTKRCEVLGDLNHYGGWHCQYCQHPEEIMEDLQQLAATGNHTANSSLTAANHSTRQQPMNANSLKQLMANGLDMDGQTKLLRLRQYADKYYAPKYVLDNSWHFGNLLVNIYENLGDDIDDDEGWF